MDRDALKQAGIKDAYAFAAIADDVIGQYFSATGTPYYVVDVDEDAYWAAVERHAIAH